MSLVARINEMIEEKSLLKHPFYEMWSAGELTKESLAGYSKEYFQLVKAIPLFMSPIINKALDEQEDATTTELKENMQEEADHIKPWIVFADKLGISKDELLSYEGLPKTREAIDELNSLMNTFDGGACAMYALEKEIPKISQTKLDGLEKFYGIGKDDDSVEYFRLHTEADIRHAASWERIIEESAPSDTEHMIEIADKSIAAQNLLLDACYEKYCTHAQ